LVAAELNRLKGQLLLRRGHSEAAEELYRKVDVVPMDAIRDLVVSHLREGAEAVEDLAAIEQASGESEVVVVTKTRHEPAIHALPDVGEGRDRHGGDRREVRRAAGPSVAVQLELAAVGRQFGKAVVTGGAFLPGLSGIAR